MNITIDRDRQQADLGMPESLRASVTTPWITTVLTTGAPFAGTTPAAGRKAVLVSGAFVGTSAWSPPF